MQGKCSRKFFKNWNAEGAVADLEIYYGLDHEMVVLKVPSCQDGEGYNSFPRRLRVWGSIISSPSVV